MLIARSARDSYRFDDALFNQEGHLTLQDFSAARSFAAQMAHRRGAPVPAGEVNALFLIDEVLRLLLQHYILQNPGVMLRALASLQGQFGAETTDTVSTEFVEEFPPEAVYTQVQPPADWLSASRGGYPHRAATLEDLLVLNILHQNPATQPYHDLSDDTPLRADEAYDPLLQRLSDFFSNQPAFGEAGSRGETLIQVLRAPALASPYSLSGQLEFLLTRWGSVLGDALIARVLRGMDYVKEEAIRGPWAGGFGGDAPVLTFGGAYAEYERFSPDRDWMPRCILMAKNTYVWLDQLSRKYERAITRLDQIPDEELDMLAARGFTGLWLIGLWERSAASQHIKQMMGDGEAVASAYSLHAYDIAGDLGGWDALGNLRWRAWQRSIRLSADMVPNHMGIDSNWVIEHPGWFLSHPAPPYPNYTFGGPDLSHEERVGIFLEDHYYSKTDAAVVFKRLDRWTGGEQFIYHGNDGTSMPWNDTAQLDYLQGEVREAVIQTILHVARNFPIIRFDAAMTLAKKHIQRLWFPEPGAGGAIPSRAEHGMTRAEFDARIPEEFWREVVDRVAAEVPDTLLLAEAFWLMEGYFVRTLGMHRVYNSAFMHMLRDEDNAKYRSVMKNVLEFDPQVLKRFVNFMNNPDEKTAIEQFGDGDKYFGVCTLLATLPGLPMFGHGQIEGFREKYGMEFRRPKWEEWPNEGLIGGHDWRIFPLLHRRHVFAEMDSFLLYDFYTTDGHVNEDVFAFSNRSGDPHSGAGERGLVVYHNKFAETSGWIKTSAAYMDKQADSLVQKNLAEGLGLPQAGYAIFRDYVSHLEYIRPCAELREKGIYVHLSAYQSHAFLDFRFVSGDQWQAVHDALDGAGAPSMLTKLEELFPAVEEAVIEKPKVKEKRAPRKKSGDRVKSKKKEVVAAERKRRTRNHSGSQT
jgi:glycosidase